MSNEYPPRVLFFGMHSYFSPPVLAALLAGGITVAAIIEPASSTSAPNAPVMQRKVLPRLSHPPLTMAHMSPSSEELARGRAIPVWEVRRLTDAAVVAQLAEYRPDAICVACFPLRIPSAVLKLPRLGCLNLHPSLLPANRGPVPLFWTFRAGDSTTGVTVHLMDEGMDSGDILVQEQLAIPDGISYMQLETRCATVGGALMTHAVWQLASGTATRTAQDEARSSYHTFPTAAAFVVQAEEWDARRLYNFICGIGHWDLPVELHDAEGRSFPVRDALSYILEDDSDDAGGVAAMRDRAWVRCKNGWVRLRP